MSSKRLGVQVQNGSKIEGSVVKVDQSVNNYYGSTTNDLQVGYYPDATLHDPSSEYCENYFYNLRNLRTLIENGKKSTSNRQNLFLIHGPVSTGKSTTAHLLMTEKDSHYVNRIWINAETSQTLEQDFRQLYRRMKALQYPLPDEQQDFKELLICIYWNLLTKPTLIVFDNAAVVDIDPNSVFKENYNLLTYLLVLRSTSLNPGKMVAPTVVITTRAVFGPHKTPSFSLSGMFFTPNTAISVNEGIVRSKIEADLQRIRIHTCGKLASFLFLLIALSGDENGNLPVLVRLLNYLCCKCPVTEVLLDPPWRVKDDDVQTGLELLVDFSVIELSSGTVNFRDTIKVGTKKILEATALWNVQNLVPPAIACTLDDAEDVELFNMILEEIDNWTNTLNRIIRNFYPYLLDNNVRPIEILVFDTFGNSLEARHDLCVIDSFGDTTKSFTVELQSKAQRHMEWTRFVLGGCTTANLKFQKQNWRTVARSKLWQGNIKQAMEEYYGKDPDGRLFYFKLYQAECSLKLGKLSQAFILSFSGIKANYYGILLCELPEVIQAKVLTSQGKHLQASKLLQTSMKQIKEASGRNSCAAASIERVLAKTEVLNCDFKTALELIGHVLAVRRQFLGVTTVRYIEAVATKVKILTLKGDYQKAEKCLSAAKNDFYDKKRYVYADGNVEEHPHFLILRYHQLKFWYQQGRYSEALKEVEAIQPLFGETNVYWFKCQLLLARIFQKTANLNRSKELLKVLMKQAEGFFEGTDNHKALKFKLAYAENLVLQGNLKKAKEVAETVLQNASPDTISHRLTANSILSQIFKFEGNMEVLPVLKKLVDRSEEFCGPFHARTLKFKLQLLEELVRTPNQQVSEVDELLNPVLKFLAEAIYTSGSETLLSWHFLHALKLVQYNRLSEAEGVISKLEALVYRKSAFFSRLWYIKAVLKSRQNPNDSMYSNLATELLLLLATRPQGTLQEPDSVEISAFTAFFFLKMRQNYSLEAVNLCLSSLTDVNRTHGPDNVRTTQTKLNLAIAYGVTGSCSTALELVDEVQSVSGHQYGFEAQVLRDALSAPSLDPDCLEYHIGGRITYSLPIVAKNTTLVSRPRKKER